MYDYIATLKTLYNQLVDMRCNNWEDQKVAILIASYGDKGKSAFCHTIYSIQSGNYVEAWDTALHLLLHEFDEQEWEIEATVGEWSMSV